MRDLTNDLLSSSVAWVYHAVTSRVCGSHHVKSVLREGVQAGQWARVEKRSVKWDVGPCAGERQVHESHVRPPSVCTFPAGATLQPFEAGGVTPLAKGGEGEMGGDAVPCQGWGLVEGDDVEKVVIGRGVVVV